MASTKQYEIGVYYFPNYHPDRQNQVWHGPGWTEWELMKHASPRFEGHQQPKIPMWGYEDESDPEVMAKKIAAAAGNGITSFIFDWYWYENGPFLERALENGFLKAANNDRLKFSLMWANHDWGDAHPTDRKLRFETLLKGAISKKAFIEATDHMIRNYFCHPSYLRVDGGLYLSFYDFNCLLNNFGSIAATREALDDLRARVEAAGLGKLHLNAISGGLPVLPCETKIENFNGLVNALGFDSVTSYVWVHYVWLQEFPLTSYAPAREKAVEGFEQLTSEYSLPYYPNVTMGWDSSPRTVQSEIYENIGYPFGPVLDGNTPEEFRKALADAKKFLDKGHTKTKMLTINAWNEWTEGSYLEPDMINGMGYLEAIRDVFGANK